MTPTYSDILFDLDGTLTDSGEGIVNSVRHALRHFGIQEPDGARLHHFVGPPLEVSFRQKYGFDEAQTARAIEVYREYFTEKGIFENAVYPGIPDLLAALQTAGKRLFVATSKPLIYARRILAHFGLDGWFSGVYGPGLDGDGTTKGDVIAQTLRENGIGPATAVMVGDREHDVLGAAQNGLPTVGVLYGYGNEEELRAAGARHIAPTVAALYPLLGAGSAPGAAHG